MTSDQTTSPDPHYLTPSLASGSQSAGSGDPVFCEWCKKEYRIEDAVTHKHKLRNIATLSGRSFKALCLTCFKAQKKGVKWDPELSIPRVQSEFERLKNGDPPSSFAESIIADGWRSIRGIEAQMKEHLDELEKLNQRLNFAKTAHAGLSKLYGKWLWDTYPERRKRANYYISNASLRMMIFSRDGYKCKTCGARNNLSIDHIKPVASGGGESPENLQTLCRECNSRKKDN